MRLLRLGGLAAATLVAGAGVYQLVLDYPFIRRKLKSQAPDCSWWNVMGAVKSTTDRIFWPIYWQSISGWWN